MARDGKQLFGRKYKLELRQPVVADVNEEAADNSAKAVQLRRLKAEFIQRYRTDARMIGVDIPRSTITITDLQIKATIPFTKDNGGRAQDIPVISIYNLSESTLNDIYVGLQVVLQAGYEQDGDELPVIYSGEVLHVETERVGTDKITTIYCSDYIIKRPGVRYTNTWPAETSFDEILSDLYNTARQHVDVGTPRIPSGEGQRLGNLLTQVGYSVSGNLFDIIDKVAREVNYRTYFVNGKFYCEPAVGPKLTTRFRLARTSIKEFIKTKRSFDPKNKIDRDSTTFKLFLDGRVQLSSYLDLERDGQVSTFLVDKITHYMDYEGDWWESEVTATPVRIIND